MPAGFGVGRELWTLIIKVSYSQCGFNRAMHYSSLLPLLFALPFPHHVYAFPQYGSLAGLTAKQLALVLPTLHPRSFTPPPDPLNDTSVKLVNDQQHPYIPPGLDDIRGPCPAMNTLANHGVSTEIRRLLRRKLI